MPSIVIIDDDEANNRLLKTLLREYDVASAHSAEEGLTLVEQYHPELILLDLRMPGMGGVAAIQILKSEPSLAHIPVIAVTASMASGELKDALDAGADGYVAKPFKPNELRGLVQQFLG